MAWYCSWCDVSFSEAFSHRTLGPVCGRCMRPVQRRRRPARAPAPALAPAVRGARRSKPPGSERMRRKLAKVADRDEWRCQLCFGSVDPGVSGGPWKATADHVVPVSAGGTDAVSNLQLAHKHCNGQRGSMPLDAWFASHPRVHAAPITEVSSLSYAARQKMQAMRGEAP